MCGKKPIASPPPRRRENPSCWLLCNRWTWPPWEIPASCSPASSQRAPCRPPHPHAPCQLWDAGAGLGGCRAAGRPPWWCGSSELLPKNEDLIAFILFFSIRGSWHKEEGPACSLYIFCLSFVFMVAKIWVSYCRPNKTAYSFLLSTITW
jgi:hypothetical protein